MRLQSCGVMFSVLCVGLVVTDIGYAADAGTVRFTSSDNIEIVADYYEPQPPLARGAGGSDEPAPVVILLHMYRSDRSAWKPLAEPLHEAGFAVLAIDMRGHGDSGNPQRAELQARARERDPSLFREMDRDVAAAHAWLAVQPGLDPARIGLVGASVGCSVAIEYASRDRSVDVVVAMTPGTSYLGLDSTRPIVAYGDRPMLLLVVEGEREATDTLALLNSAVTKRIVGRSTAHGTRMFRVIDGIESVIVDFLKRGVGGPSANPVVGTFGGSRYYDNVDELKAALQRFDKSKLRWYSSAQEAEGRGLKRGVARQTVP